MFRIRPVVPPRALALLMLLLAAPLLSCNPFKDSPIERTPELVGAGTELAIPAAPAQAAAYLAEQVHDERTGRAAVRELLSRSGIPIFRAKNGALANEPAVPTLVDAYVYDFQVPMLAAAAQEGGRIPYARLAALLSAPLGEASRVDAEAAAAALAGWIRTATATPSAPGAFHALAVQALGKAKGRDDDPAQASATESSLDPLQLVIVLASAQSKRGTIGPAPKSVKTDLRSLRCKEPKKNYDSGVPEWAAKTFLEEGLGEKGAKVPKVDAASNVNDALDLLATAEARIALLAGLRVELVNDAKSPHLRHSTGELKSWTWTATARWKTPYPGAMVSCGPLAGYRIPNDGPVEGLKMQWTLQGGQSQTLTPADAKKLKRGGGGGEVTDANGQSKLRVETVIEKGCPGATDAQTGIRLNPDPDKCKKGETSEAPETAKVEFDLTTEPPVKLADLLLFKHSDITKFLTTNLIKILIDIATDIATSRPAAQDTVKVAYHGQRDYRLEVNQGGVTLSALKCEGKKGPWTLHFKQTASEGGYRLTLTGTVDFTLDEGGDGPYKGKIIGRPEGLPRQVTIDFKFSGSGRASVTDDGDGATLSLDENVWKLDASGFGSTGASGHVAVNKSALGKDGRNSYPLEVGNFCGAK